MDLRVHSELAAAASLSRCQLASSASAPLLPLDAACERHSVDDCSVTTQYNTARVRPQVRMRSEPPLWRCLLLSGCW